MASENSPGFSWMHRTFCLVTGASRGIGKEIAVQFGQRLKKGSVMLLVARDMAKLSQVKAQIESQSPDILVSIASVDFTTSENSDYVSVLTNCLKELAVTPKDFQHALIVHNASTNVQSGLVSQWEDPSIVESYMRMNVYSALFLNTQFFKLFDKESVEKRTVIQVTSLLGTEPFRNAGLYCMGKAARDIIFKVLAVEEPSILVLAYSPGPVNTDMFQEAGLNNADEESRVKFQKMIDDGMVLTTEQTVKKLVGHLEGGKYKSGDKLSYYTDIKV